MRYLGNKKLNVGQTVSVLILRGIQHMKGMSSECVKRCWNLVYVCILLYASNTFKTVVAAFCLELFGFQWGSISSMLLEIKIRKGSMLWPLFLLFVIIFYKNLHSFVSLWSLITSDRRRFVNLRRSNVTAFH